MAVLEPFFPQLLKFEGGFVNDPADPGGATNMGITLNTFIRYAPSLLNIPATLDNLKALTDSQALTIYRAGYWKPILADEMNDQGTAEIIFDFYVNAGGNAIRLLQTVINNINPAARLNIDGSMGPATLSALNAGPADPLYRNYKQGRIDYYRKLAAQRPELQKFLNGWLNRVAYFPDR